MSEDAEEKPTIVIDGKVLTEQLDERMIHDVVNGFYDEIRKDTVEIATKFCRSLRPR